MAFAQEDCFRHVTPPTGSDPYFNDPHSAGTDRTFNSCPDYHASPESVHTHLTTPPQSPPMRHSGPQLLPKVRSQDQVIDPIDVQSRHVPSRSVTSTGFPITLNENYMLQRPGAYHRSLSPPEVGMGASYHLSTNPSHIDNCRSRTVSPMPSALLGLQRPSFAHSRSTSMSSVYTHSQSHSRNVSGNFDANSVRKYISPSNLRPPVVSHSRQPSISIAPAPEMTQPDFLAPELSFDSYPTPPRATTLMDYLTGPNPSPALVRRVPPPNRLTDNYFWWDIRNLRTWSSFTLDTIQSIPDLTTLLELPIPEPALPTPSSRLDVNPESLSSLQDTCSGHYATKVNAALRVALGNSHLTYSAPKANGPGVKQNADFVANYATDYERTIFGEGRGRVVGLVKSFSTWNSGMRSQSGTSGIDYQKALSHLHLHMREHSCRYGFILTEIELVCVRMGTDAVPYFGLMELSPPIEVKASGRGQMTVALALWYLGMLAKDMPLPGQCGWKVDVGGPAALTRQHILPRDSWMLKVEGREKRDAKRIRGWVMPDESLSRKEVGKGRRGAR